MKLQKRRMRSMLLDKKTRMSPTSNVVRDNITRRINSIGRTELSSADCLEGVMYKKDQADVNHTHRTQHARVVTHSHVVQGDTRPLESLQESGARCIEVFNFPNGTLPSIQSPGRPLRPLRAPHKTYTQMASPNIPESSPSSSKLYASGRKDSLACAQRAFPKTPTKQAALTKQETSPSHDRANTVRKRRGFRPLSVLTTSAFYPFDSDTLHAMEAVTAEETSTTDSVIQSVSEVDNCDQPEPSSTSTEHSEKSLQAVSADRDQATSSASNLYHNQIRYPSTNSLITIISKDKAEISLQEFLKTSSPSAPTIKADYTSLLDLPAPDPSEHPAFQPNPFTSQSGSPDLVTTTTANSIRKLTAEARRSYSLSIGTRASASSEPPRSAEKRRFFPFDSFKTPESLHKRSSKSPLDSPLSKRYRPIEIPPMSAKTSSSDDGESRRIGSGGLRKLSDLFRSRTSVDTIPENENGLSPISLNYNESPFDHLVRLEKHLRTVTYSPVYEHSDSSWYPRHPESLRSWRSRNLKCVTCEEASCPCCHRACCAFKAAVMAQENHSKGSKCWREAAERIQQITAVFPYGKEVSTFLQCSHSGTGEGPGCGKRVCPDCCGKCPEEACGDIQCRKCKPNFWAPCDWHTSPGGDTASMVSENTVARTV